MTKPKVAPVQGVDTNYQEAPQGVFDVAGLDTATRALLDQAGELVINGRLVTAPLPATVKDGTDA